MLGDIYPQLMREGFRTGLMINTPPATYDLRICATNEIISFTRVTKSTQCNVLAHLGSEGCREKHPLEGVKSEEIVTTCCGDCQRENETNILAVGR